jgi:hypothetical protein
MSLGNGQSILNTCKVDLFDVPHIVRDAHVGQQRRGDHRAHQTFA